MSEHEVVEANRASELLRKLGRGGADIRFAERVAEVTEAVTNYGGKGEVTIKVKIERNKLPSVGGVVMYPEVSCKCPEESIGGTLMVQGNNGELLTQAEFLQFGGGDEKARVEVAREHNVKALAAAAEGKRFGAEALADSPKPAPLADADDDDEDDDE